jgi:hypothetical protein
MKNALISPNEIVSYVSGWIFINGIYRAEFTPVGQRIAEICEQVFEVAQPLFWVECSDAVNANDFYYSAETQQCLRIPDPAPMPQQS